MRTITRFIVENENNRDIANKICLDCGGDSADDIVSSKIKSISILDTIYGEEADINLSELSLKELRDNTINCDSCFECLSEYNEFYWGKITKVGKYPNCIVCLKDNGDYNILYCESDYPTYIEKGNDLEFYEANGIASHYELRGLDFCYFIVSKFEYKGSLDRIYIEYIRGSGYGITYSFNGDDTYPLYIHSFKNEPNYRDKFLEMTSVNDTNNFAMISIDTDIIGEVNGSLLDVINNDIVKVGDTVYILNLNQNDLVLPNGCKMAYVFNDLKWRNLVFPASIEKIVWWYTGDFDCNKCIYLPSNAKADLITSHLIRSNLSMYFSVELKKSLDIDKFNSEYKTAKNVVEFLGDYLDLQIKFY